MHCPYCEKVYKPDDHPGAHEVDCAADILLWGLDAWISIKTLGAVRYVVDVLLTEADGLDEEHSSHGEWHSGTAISTCTAHTDAINAVIARVYSNNEEPRE